MSIVYILEDDYFKFKDISDILKSLLPDNPMIIRDDNYSDACSTIRRVCSEADFVITDNYVPSEKSHGSQIPIAISFSELVKELDSDLPVIVCSSGSVDDGPYDYFIRYQDSDRLEEQFGDVIRKIEYQKESREIEGY